MRSGDERGSDMLSELEGTEEERGNDAHGQSEESVSDRKRQRQDVGDGEHSSVEKNAACILRIERSVAIPAQTGCDLLNLPSEVLESSILSLLDAPTLATLARTAKAFRVRGREDGLLLLDKVARDQLVRWHGPELAERWRHCGWLERLHIEQAVTLFDRSRCEKQGFVFTTEPPPGEAASPASQASLTGSLSPSAQAAAQAPASSSAAAAPSCPGGRVVGVKLDGIGPKLLVSDAVLGLDTPLLRWRLELKGNNAVEFGTIPIALQDHPKALHKCASSSDGARPSGFCSAITVGSMLPVKLPLMRGSVVEILASKGRLRYIVTNPPNGMEMTWHNTITVPKPYKGPLEFRFEQDLPPDQPVKLAVTCWARAAFEVLHTRTAVAGAHGLGGWAFGRANGGANGGANVALAGASSSSTIDLDDQIEDAVGLHE